MPKNKDQAVEIQFDQKTFREFIKKYNQAVSENKTVFVFQGCDVVVSYAKYVIEHLKNQFAKAGIKI
jgi:hypothetical protein